MQTTRYELEEFTRFSESHLWKLMMSFYEKQVRATDCIPRRRERLVFLTRERNLFAARRA